MAMATGARMALPVRPMARLSFSRPLAAKAALLTQRSAAVSAPLVSLRSHLCGAVGAPGPAHCPGFIQWGLPSAASPCLRFTNQSNFAVCVSPRA
jgi:hypothetical protein